MGGLTKWPGIGVGRTPHKTLRDGYGVGSLTVGEPSTGRLQNYMSVSPHI